MKRAILVTYREKSVLDEAVELASSAEYRLVGTVTQRYLSHAKFGLGAGKAEEVAEMVRDLKAEAIIFDERLRTRQAYELAKLTGVEVIDREKLILEIFAKRAQTTEAKLQVQLADLRYEMPRAKEKVRIAKMGEQPGFLGLGRYEAETLTRDIKRRIGILNRKLIEVSRRRELYRIQRERMSMPTISLAGYTGAGKTSLFNTLTGETRQVDSGAFTTLTTTTRIMRSGDFSALLSDTVGFISRLPAYMIEAFRSTLEELTYASLVLLVVDASEEMEVTEGKYLDCVKTLSQLGVSPGKVLVVFNKLDISSQTRIQEAMRGLSPPEGWCVAVSAKTREGVEDLIRIMAEKVSGLSEMTFMIGAEEMLHLSRELDWLKRFSNVRFRQGGRNGLMEVEVRGPSWVVDRFRSILSQIPGRRE